MLRVSSGFISEWDGCDLINQRKRQWKTSKKQKCIERNNGSVSSGVHNSDLWMCAAANTPYRYGHLRCALIRSWLCLPHTKIAEKKPEKPWRHSAFIHITAIYGRMFSKMVSGSYLHLLCRYYADEDVYVCVFNWDLCGFLAELKRAYLCPGIMFFSFIHLGDYFLHLLFRRWHFDFHFNRLLRLQFAMDRNIEFYHICISLLSSFNGIEQDNECVCVCGSTHLSNFIANGTFIICYKCTMFIYPAVDHFPYI